MSQIVLPFEFPSDTEIIYADPSEDPEFLINTSFLVAVDSKSFVEMVSSYWSSVEAFSDSDIALFMKAANGEENETNDSRRFILHLAENGVSSDLIKNHIFKVKEKNLSTGLLFFDCVRLPDHSDSQKTCKLSYCSSAALKFPAINVDFFLYSFNLKEDYGNIFDQKEVASSKRSFSEIVIGDAKRNDESRKKLKSDVRNCIESMKDSLMKLRPVVMLWMGEIQKRKGFEMPDKYDGLIALLSDDESMKELVEAKFSTYQEEEEDTFSEKASSEDSEVLALFLQVVPGSAAILNIFNKEIEKDLVVLQSVNVHSS